MGDRANDVPDASLARQIAAAATGREPTDARRFPTGAAHYVFEVTFATGAPVVVRLGSETGRVGMMGASTLSTLLRPLGLKLPAVLAEDVAAKFPYLVLERLPGTDLGHIIDRLSPAQLSAVAAEVAAAQQIVAARPTAGRYGYAIRGEDAPHSNWSSVLEAHLERSRQRIASAGLFTLDAVDAASALILRRRPELDSQPAIPFLHDTTTKNVIVTEAGRFSGIVDVDDLCYGDPRYVVALTSASLLVSGGPGSYVEAWLARAGFKDDRLFRLYVLLFLVDFMSEHGQRFNGNAAASTTAARGHLRRLVEERLERIAD